MGNESRPLRLLSLDGGGIRGLSSLYCLKTIMQHLQSSPGSADPLHTYKYFDLIARTSTGGLIAVMLGVLRMDIQKCIDIYIEVAPKMFPVSALSGSSFGKAFRLLAGTQQFDSRPLEEIVKKLVVTELGELAIEGKKPLLPSM